MQSPLFYFLTSIDTYYVYPFSIYCISQLCIFLHNIIFILLHQVQKKSTQCCVLFCILLPIINQPSYNLPHRWSFSDSTSAVPSFSAYPSAEALPLYSPHTSGHTIPIPGSFQAIPPSSFGCQKSFTL